MEAGVGEQVQGTLRGHPLVHAKAVLAVWVVAAPLV